MVIGTVFLLGIVWFTLGLAIRIWAQQYLGYRIPKKYRKAQRKKLVTTGPYRLCRNPVYIGNILIITGLPLMAGAPHVAPLSLVWSFLTYNVVVSKYEEPHQIEKFGPAYAAYLRNVPRWVPQPQVLRQRPGDPNPFPVWLAFKFEIHNIIWTFPFIFRYLLLKP
ncbi:MAG: hypothetical protein DRG59_04220 [Deltaproteobacteria bacterium]|nr:MAG: hypothetical protein DRG83_18820 [Deltaproteobacteria bacterium]RLB08740.1 MAG: hypothetical protein DRG59_04220 [Deltaproteobacteria bacterium]